MGCALLKEKVPLGAKVAIQGCVGRFGVVSDCCVREKSAANDEGSSGRKHYNYFRDYDPSIGRYINSDPIGLWGGLNTYGYAYQNPINYFDPDGRLVWFGIPAAYWGAGAAGAAATLWWAQNNPWAPGNDNAPSLPSSPNWYNNEDGSDSSGEYPANPDNWNPPDGWTETPAGEKTGGKHRQWNGPDGKTRRWDREGRKGGKERGPHWHDSDRPGEHILPNCP